MLRFQAVCERVHRYKVGGASLNCINFVVPMNPCPCGYYPDRNRCTCSQSEVQRYLSKISGPVLDRIDVTVEAPRVDIKQLSATAENECSADIRMRVLKARERQQRRYKGTRYHFNAELSGSDIKRFCPLGAKEQELSEQIFTRMNLSARAYHKMIKVARTIADLEGAQEIDCGHLSEAACYRMCETKYEH